MATRKKKKKNNPAVTGQADWMLKDYLEMVAKLKAYRKWLQRLTGEKTTWP